MNVPLVLAGSLTLLGAAIHGGAGQALVVRRLSVDGLPGTRFGGPRMTMAMIQITWHLATIAFLTIGTTFIVAGTVFHGGTARAVGVIPAAASSVIAVLILSGVLGQVREAFTTRDWRPALHPAPPLLIAVVVLGWIGVA